MNCYDECRMYNDYREYVVQSGDTLFSIAKRYNTTVEELMKTNNLSSTMIFPNQILIVPYMMNGQMSDEEYLTVVGDNMNGIAKRFNISPNALARINDIYALKLAPNQIIKLNGYTRDYVISSDDNVNTIMNKTGLNCSQLVEMNSDTWLRVGNVIKVK